MLSSVMTCSFLRRKKIVASPKIVPGAAGAVWKQEGKLRRCQPRWRPSLDKAPLCTKPFGKAVEGLELGLVQREMKNRIGFLFCSSLMREFELGKHHLVGAGMLLESSPFCVTVSLLNWTWKCSSLQGFYEHRNELLDADRMVAYREWLLSYMDSNYGHTCSYSFQVRLKHVLQKMPHNALEFTDRRHRYRNLEGLFFFPLVCKSYPGYKHL